VVFRYQGVQYIRDEEDEVISESTGERVGEWTVRQPLHAASLCSAQPTRPTLPG
jgi:hypothetical protein